MNGEELECATRIDQHPQVRRWIRNLDRETQGGFCLPLSPGRFFPDFVVELENRTLIMVEYKMGKMAHDPAELHKKAVGELWAARSHNQACFAWVVNRDWQTLEKRLTG